MIVFRLPIFVLLLSVVLQGTQAYAQATVMPSAEVRSVAKSYAGAYNGSLGADGVYSIWVREDKTGVFLGYLEGGITPVVCLGISLAEDGSFGFSTEPAKTAAGGGLTVYSSPIKISTSSGLVFSGKISAEGVLEASLRARNGEGMLTLSSAKNSGSISAAGFYEAQSAGGTGVVYTIISPSGSVLSVGVDSAAGLAGSGLLGADGTATLSSGGDSLVSVSLLSGGEKLQVKQVSSAGRETVYVGCPEHYRANQRLVNLSSRSFSGSDNRVATAGFIVGGTQNKLVLLRAVGPTLAKYGVNGAMKAPSLELYQGQQRIGFNKGWTTDAKAAAIASAAKKAGAFDLAEASADSALLVSLPPGNYTALAKGESDEGVALVEVYDLSEVQAGQQLLDISSRAWVGKDAQALVAGFVIGGWVPKRVLIRAVGPTLSCFGLPEGELLAHPQIQLFREKTLVTQVGAWGGSASASLIRSSAAAVGAFPLASDQESALVISLEPGAYTAQVVGADGGTGIAIVEVYEVP